MSGVAFAVVQTIRIGELRRHNRADVWLSIAITRAALSKIESTPAHKQDTAVAETHSKLAELFRQLVKMATVDEKKFNKEMLDTWRSEGKLDPGWQEKQAMQFL